MSTFNKQTEMKKLKQQRAQLHQKLFEQTSNTSILLFKIKGYSTKKIKKLQNKEKRKTENEVEITIITTNNKYY